MSIQKVRSDFPTEIVASPLAGILQALLAPPRLETENAALEANQNGVELDKKEFPNTKYRKPASNATDFSDILGPSLPAAEAVRVDLVRNGYNPTPVKGKAAVLPNWSKRKPDEIDARRWSVSHATASNTGIVLGSKLVAIDVDILDVSTAERLVSEAEKLGNGTPLVRVGQAPKTLLLFRTDKPVSKRATGKYRRADGEKEQGVEILGAGQQFVANGIHPDTGKPYQWLGASPLDVPLNSLPLIDHARLDTFMQAADARLATAGWKKIRPATGERKADLFEDILGGAPKANERLGAEKCREILADLPSEWCENRDSWIRVGMALHHEFSGHDDGFDIWNSWSRHSPKYDQQDIKRDWRSFRDKSQIVTIGTLVKAGEANRQARIDRQLDSEFEDLGEDDLAKPAPKPKSGLTFLSPSDCSAMPSRGYVIKGFIAPGDVACIFGEPGAGKSMIAPYLGYAVAQGREAFGMRTKPGKVFYLPMEDEAGMQMRVRALHEQHGDTDNFFVVRGASIHGDEGLKELLLEVKRQRPALIIIDTLAASWPGLEENSSEAMSKVVAVGKRLARFGAAVVFIHHSTKDSNGTPRGHSVLNGALDVSMELFKLDENGIARGRLRKNRNGPCELDIAFRIQSHEFGIDEDGDPITAGYCEPCQPGSAPKAVRLTIPQREALTILRDMATTGDMAPLVAVEEWRKRCLASPIISQSDKPHARRTAFGRAFETLLKAGCVFRQGENVGLEETSSALGDDEFDDLGEDSSC